MTTFISNQILSSSVKSQAIKIDMRLLNNRYNIELNNIKGNEYEKRSNKIALDRKYAVVKEALISLYQLGIQHDCNLRELLDNYNIVVGEVIK